MRKSKSAKRARDKRYYHRNKEKVRVRQKARWLENLLKNARKHAKDHGVPFCITLEYLEDLYYRVQGEKCAYSCRPMKPSSEPNALRQPSLDRIIPKDGYVPFNVVFCEWGMNRAKGAACYRDFIVWIDDLRSAA